MRLVGEQVVLVPAAPRSLFLRVQRRVRRNERLETRDEDEIPSAARPVAQRLVLFHPRMVEIRWPCGGARQQWAALGKGLVHGRVVAKRRRLVGRRRAA